MIKYLILIFLVVGCKPNEDKTTIYSTENISMPDYYRRVTGYDTIQLIVRHGKIEANFCYPNQLELEKFRKDTIVIHDNAFRIVGNGSQHNNTGSGSQIINNK